MKTDTITFTTKKSLPEIANILRRASSDFKAQLSKLNDDPLGSLGGQEPEIAEGMTGSNFLGFGARGWGIEIYVTDLGTKRSVELIALGDGLMRKMSGGEFFDLGLGKKHRDKLANMLA